MLESMRNRFEIGNPSGGQHVCVDDMGAGPTQYAQGLEESPGQVPVAFVSDSLARDTAGLQLVFKLCAPGVEQDKAQVEPFPVDGITQPLKRDGLFYASDDVCEAACHCKPS